MSGVAILDWLVRLAAAVFLLILLSPTPVLGKWAGRMWASMECHFWHGYNQRYREMMGDDGPPR